MIDIAALERELRFRKLFAYKPYWWQREFHAAGVSNAQRLLRAANRTGKTYSAAAEIALHATGLYDEVCRRDIVYGPDHPAVLAGMAEADDLVWPDGWPGVRFERPELIWIGSVTNEASRDIVQKELLGGTGDSMGTGAIPRDFISRKPSLRQCGISDVVDVCYARHKAGHECQIVFKSYDQGWRKWQGTAPITIWLDEEPDENKQNEKKIFTEALTRILSSRGSLLGTLTPLLGETEIVDHFGAGKPGTFMMNASWDDAPHLDVKLRAELLASYPEHERDVRTKGIPALGSGRVFTLPEEAIRCDPFQIPRYWARMAGCDFGVDHPAAGAWLAHDRENDVVYLTDCYRQAGQQPIYHAAQFRARGGWIPVAWPHDGATRDKGGQGKRLAQQYRASGANLMSISARYRKAPDEKDDPGGAQPVEPILQDLIERMHTGRFRVFPQCSQFFEEYRSYHRKDGKLVLAKDDILKAVMYALMMLRFAIAEPVFRRQPGAMRPMVGMR